MGNTSGVEPHPDFDIEAYHFALGAIQTETDDLGRGTCYASKIVGLYGVAKRGRLNVMKIGAWMESIADGLRTIMDIVRDMPVGFTVIALDRTWVSLGGKQTQLNENLITILERDYQVPIVVKSGNDEPVVARSDNKPDEDTESQMDDMDVIALPGLVGYASSNRCRSRQPA